MEKWSFYCDKWGIVEIDLGNGSILKGGWEVPYEQSNFIFARVKDRGPSISLTLEKGKTYPMKIWLSSPHMGGNEQKYVKEAFDTNWIAPLGPNVNKFDVTKKVLSEIKKLFRLEKSQIDKPIVESDIINAVINVSGVLSLIELKLTSLSGTVNGRDYSEQQIDFEGIKNNGIFFPPSGGIFELRYPNEDIVITVR